MIGPSVPEEFLKRKRTPSPEPESKVENVPDQAQSSARALAPPPVAPLTKPERAGPELPAHLLAAREAKRKARSEKAAREAAAKEEAERQAKRARVLGPAPPPPQEDDDSDDDVGPMLPTGPVDERFIERQFILRAGTSAVPGAAATDSDGKPKRDDWMLAPPTQAAWATSADARKVRARTFNTGKSGKDAASSGGDVDSRVWTETPQERARRLEEEVMGVRAPTLQGHATQVTKEETREEREKRERDEDIAARVRSARGPSLMEQHKEQQKQKDEEEKDDPSKRGFDREKDVVGRKVTGKMRDQLVEKARGLGGMFEGGKYL